MRVGGTVRALGSSRVAKLKIEVGYSTVEVKARVNLFGTDLGLVLEPAEYAGFFMVPRWEELINLLGNGSARKEFRWRPEHLRYQLVRSLFHALRQIEHIVLKYGLDMRAGEKQLLTRAREVALILNSYSLGLGREVQSPYPRNLTRVSAEVIKQLGEPRSLPVREGQAYLKAVLVKRDSAGRANETAAMVKALAASDRFRERLEDGVMCIEPVVVMRQKALLNLFYLTEYQIEVTLDLVNRLLRLPLRRRELKTLDRRRLANRLNFLGQELDRFEFNPYRLSFSDAAGELRLAAKDLFGLGQTDWPRALPPLEITRRSLEIKQRQIEIERIIFALTRQHYGVATHLTLDEAARRIRQINRFFEALDDSRFKRRIRLAVLNSLDAALMNLPSAPDLARESLKSASELL
ncbi:MAG: hypothetical protein QME74_12120 [Candidatus Edwardsbacteria bacterium]|nr:hypothetical protein [Candidatus Edwardsbacteria bacterium]